MVMRLMHIDQLDTLYKSCRIKIHLGSLGVTGVKSSFSQKTLFLQHITWYGHVTHAYLSDRYLYRSNRSKNSFGVIWGHRGSKSHFHLKGYNSSMLHSMTIRHMCIRLRPSTYVMGSNDNLGSFGVSGVKRSISPNCSNLSLLNSLTIILKHMH